MLLQNDEVHGTLLTFGLKFRAPIGATSEDPKVSEYGISIDPPGQRRPSRTCGGSAQRSCRASVSALQCSIMLDNGRKECCTGSGRLHNRRSSPAMISSCSASGSAPSAFPGSQRSSSMAPRASSASSNCTVGSPFQKQPRDLVRALHVRHAELQHRTRSVLARHLRHPRTAHLIAIERIANLEIPSLFQIADHARQSREPIGRVRCPRAGRCQPCWDTPCWDKERHPFTLL